LILECLQPTGITAGGGPIMCKRIEGFMMDVGFNIEEAYDARLVKAVHVSAKVMVHASSYAVDCILV